VYRSSLVFPGPFARTSSHPYATTSDDLSTPPTSTEASPETSDMSSCLICWTRMPSRSLPGHLMTQHRGGAAKRFQCEICDRKFAHRTAIDNHRRLHTGERPHQCPMCGMAFPSLSGLTQHKDSWHPI